MSTRTRLQSEMVGSSLDKQSCSKEGIVSMHNLRLNQKFLSLSVACDELENYFYEKLLSGHKMCVLPHLFYFLSNQLV